MFCVIILSLFVVAPPLSVDSVTAVLGGVAHKWIDVGVLLCIPDATLSYILHQCKDDMERLRRVVRYWLLKDPLDNSYGDCIALKMMMWLILLIL